MKSKLELLLLAPISLLAFSISCENLSEKWYTIKIENNTTKQIFVSAGCGKYGMTSYPDTILPDLEPSLLSVSSFDYNNLRSSIAWEDIIKQQPEDVLSIYFFNADTINQYEWSEIKQGNKVMERRELSLEDLQGMNWTITYP
jgi:hypothetical protein